MEQNREGMFNMLRGVVVISSLSITDKKECLDFINELEEESEEKE